MVTTSTDTCVSPDQIVTCDTFKKLIDTLALRYKNLKDCVELWCYTSAVSATGSTGKLEYLNFIAYQAVTAGCSGNDISIEIKVDQSALGSVVTTGSILVSGNQIIVFPPQDASGTITATAEDIVILINGDVTSNTLVEAAVANTQVGQVYPDIVTLTGGRDQAVILDLRAEDSSSCCLYHAEESFLATNKIAQWIQWNPFWKNSIQSMSTHLAGFDKNISSYIDECGIQAPYEFSELHCLGEGTHLNAIQTYLTEAKNLARIGLLDGGVASETVRSYTNKALLNLYSASTFNDILLESASSGVTANGITVTIEVPTLANQPLQAWLSGDDIHLICATDALGDNSTSALDAVTAFNNHADISTLVTASTSTSGLGRVTAASGRLTNNRNEFDVSTVSTGSRAEGTILMITQQVGASLTTTISETVSVTGIVTVAIALGTDASSEPNVYASDIVSFINTNSTYLTASQSVTYTDGGDLIGTGTYMLTGAVQGLITSNTPTGTGDGLASETNVGPSEVCLTIPDISTNATESLNASEYGMYEFLDTGDGDGFFVVSKTLTNTITFQLKFFSTPSHALTVVVTGNHVEVQLATDSGSQITSTAADVIAAINSDVSAAALMYASSREGSTTTGVLNTGSEVVTLANQGNVVHIAAAAAGSAGNGIKVEVVDPAAVSSALSVAVVGTDITVSLGTDANGDLISGAEEVRDLINSTIASAALISTTASGVGIVQPLAVYLSKGSDSPLANDIDLTLVLQKTATTTETREVTIPAGTVDGQNILLSPTNAELTLGTQAAANILKLTALTSGDAGNTLNITLVDPALPLQSESVTVSGEDITVQLATGHDGEISSTPLSLKTLLDSDVSSSALVSTAIDTDYSYNNVSAQTKTLLTGGADSLKYLGLVSATLTSGGTEGLFINLDAKAVELCA